jgi:curved DNA-binding protein CbpA
MSDKAGGNKDDDFEDEEEDHSMKFIKSVFGDQSFYDILSVKKDCTADEIKKSYRKLALKYHPDREGGSENHFKAISVVYATLSDEEKRKLYDEGGLTSDSAGLSGDFDFWYKYYRDMFPPVTVSQIDDYKGKYIGSQEERGDIIKCYLQNKGDLMKMINYIMFAELEDVEAMKRIIDIVEQAIASSEIELLPKFTSTKEKFLSSSCSSKVRSSKRQKLDDSSHFDAANDDDSANSELSNIGGGAGSSKGGNTQKSSKGVKAKSKVDSMDDLVAAIQRNRGSGGMASKIAELESRYTKPPSKQGRK